MTNLTPDAPQATVERMPGDTNFQKWGFDAHPIVAPVAGGSIVLFAVFALAFGEQAEGVFTAARDFIADSAGWFYVLATNIYLGVAIALALSKYGRVRLGGPDAKPEFSTFTWYAMLVSAGMGIGLMFWSVAEPIFHFSSPPGIVQVEPGTPAAAEAAMGVTFFHWGLHPWGIYALVGLALAFFNFNRGRPLTISAIFYPLLKEKIYEWPGHVIDILAVLATLSGLATSLGSGAQQVSSGLNFLFGLPDTPMVQVILIVAIVVLSGLSVATGLKRGVRWLSEINIYFSIALLLFVVVVGPTRFILDSFVEDLGYYISMLPSLSFWTEAYAGTQWQDNWTLFYWGWWIAWSPFVGTFIARVSSGRTVREFVLGVLVVPSMLSFLWMSVFGGSALHLSLNGVSAISTGVSENVATALFVMLEQFPLTQLSSLLAVILVITFFVTSSNSGALVVNYLTSGGKLEQPIFQRLFWVAIEGAIAVVLLLGGGLDALQTASLTMGLPFACVLLVMCYSLYRGLEADYTSGETAKLRLLSRPVNLNPLNPQLRFWMMHDVFRNGHREERSRPAAGDNVTPLDGRSRRKKQQRN